MERLFESLKLISNSVPTRDNRNSDRQFGSSDLFLGAADPAVASVAVFGGTQVILIGRGKSPRCGINPDTLLCQTLSLHRVELQTVRRIVFVNIPDVVHGFLTDAF